MRNAGWEVQIVSVGDAMAVGNHERRPVVALGFQERTQCLAILRTHGDDVIQTPKTNVVSPAIIHVGIIKRSPCDPVNVVLSTFFLPSRLNAGHPLVDQ